MDEINYHVVLVNCCLKCFKKQILLRLVSEVLDLFFDEIFISTVAYENVLVYHRHLQDTQCGYVIGHT